MYSVIDLNLILVRVYIIMLSGVIFLCLGMNLRFTNVIRRVSIMILI